MTLCGKFAGRRTEQLLNKKRAEEDKEGEVPSVSLEAGRTTVIGDLPSTAEKWICVEIAKRTLASSILGQHVKRLEKLTHA